MPNQCSRLLQAPAQKDRCCWLTTEVHIGCGRQENASTLHIAYLQQSEQREQQSHVI